MHLLCSCMWNVPVPVNTCSFHCSDQSCCSVRLPVSAQRSEQHVLSGQHGQWRSRAHHRSVNTAQLPFSTRPSIPSVFFFCCFGLKKVTLGSGEKRKIPEALTLEDAKRIRVMGDIPMELVNEVMMTITDPAAMLGPEVSHVSSGKWPTSRLATAASLPGCFNISRLIC